MPANAEQLPGNDIADVNAAEDENPPRDATNVTTAAGPVHSGYTRAFCARGDASTKVVPVKRTYHGREREILEMERFQNYIRAGMGPIMVLAGHESAGKTSTLIAMLGQFGIQLPKELFRVSAGLGTMRAKLIKFTHSETFRVLQNDEVIFENSEQRRDADPEPNQTDDIDFDGLDVIEFQGKFYYFIM